MLIIIISLNILYFKRKMQNLPLAYNFAMAMHTTLMKNIVKITKIALLILILSSIMFPFFSIFENENIASAYDIFAKLNDDIIKMYEEDIAKNDFISSMKEEQLNALAITLNISIPKLKAVLIIKDLAFRVGEHKALEDLAKMRDLSLISYAKTLADKYGDTLPDTEKEQLKQKLKSVLKTIF